jgi:hypothetical protein
MDRTLHEQTIDFFFTPTKALLRQYGRYAEPEEVTSLRMHFDSLKLDLESAFTIGDMYEAYLIRQELKEVCNDLRQRIDVYRQESVARV